MTGLYEMLLNEQNRLKQIIMRSSERLAHAPEGRLRLTTTKQKTQYYHVLPGKTGHNGVYLSKNNKTLVEKLAQKEYDAKVLKLAQIRMRQIGVLLSTYRDSEIEQVYTREHPERKKLIIPVETTWRQRLEEWYAKPYEGKTFAEDTPLIITEKGERVRSKSEKIIADFLNKKEILYKYECPLFLKGYGTVYPDFTLLSSKTGKEVYLEHEGRMDDPNYAENAVRKIDLYGKNGIFPGERLILTYETMQTMINMAVLEQQLMRVL